MAAAGALNHRTDRFRLLIAHVGAIHAAVSVVDSGRGRPLIPVDFIGSELVTMNELFHPARGLEQGGYRLLMIVTDE